jgi:hypothetical protein
LALVDNDFLPASCPLVLAQPRVAAVISISCVRLLVGLGLRFTSFLAGHRYVGESLFPHETILCVSKFGICCVASQSRRAPGEKTRCHFRAWQAE